MGDGYIQQNRSFFQLRYFTKADTYITTTEYSSDMEAATEIIQEILPKYETATHALSSEPESAPDQGIIEPGAIKATANVVGPSPA